MPTLTRFEALKARELVEQLVVEVLAREDLDSRLLEQARKHLLEIRAAAKPIDMGAREIVNAAIDAHGEPNSETGEPELLAGTLGADLVQAELAEFLKGGEVEIDATLDMKQLYESFGLPGKPWRLKLG